MSERKRDEEPRQGKHGACMQTRWPCTRAGGGLQGQTGSSFLPLLVQQRLQQTQSTRSRGDVPCPMIQVMSIRRHIHSHRLVGGQYGSTHLVPGRQDDFVNFTKSLKHVHELQGWDVWVNGGDINPIFLFCFLRQGLKIVESLRRVVWPPDFDRATAKEIAVHLREREDGGLWGVVLDKAKALHTRV